VDLPVGLPIVAKFFEQPHLSPGFEQCRTAFLQLLGGGAFHADEIVTDPVGPTVPAGEGRQVLAVDDGQPREEFPGLRLLGCQRRLLGLNGTELRTGVLAFGFGNLKLRAAEVEDPLQAEVEGGHGSWAATAPSCWRV